MSQRIAQVGSARITRLSLAALGSVALALLGAAPTSSCGPTTPGSGGAGGAGGAGGPLCGNGVRDNGELCDGTDLGGQSCADHGMKGTLGCSGLCSFDLSGCAPLSCGNGVIDPNSGERCDGEDLGGFTCETVPLTPSRAVLTGPLRCSSLCQYDISECRGCIYHRTVVCQ
jgi:hypothetical protein